MNITIKNPAAKFIKVRSEYIKYDFLIFLPILDIPIPSDKDQLTIMDEMLESLVQIQ